MHGITLYHEVLDDTMELAAFVSLALWLLSKLLEVLRRLRHIFAKQSDHNSSRLLAANFDIEIDFVRNRHRITKCVDLNKNESSTYPHKPSHTYADEQQQCKCC